MKQIKIVGLLLIAISYLGAMQHGQEKQSGLIITSSDYAAWYRQRFVQNDPTLKHEPFLCQKCHKVDVNIPGNQVVRWQICGHRCCVNCMEINSRTWERSKFCPLCGAYSSASAKRSDCITCALLASLTLGAAVCRIVF